MLPAYHEAYRQGEFVRIVDESALQKFQQDWKYHHPLQDAQLAYAGKKTFVRRVSYYHGGDCLYELGTYVLDEAARMKPYPTSHEEAVPGYWHEQCLLDSYRNEWEAQLPPAHEVYNVTAATHHGERVIIVKTHTQVECLIARQSQPEQIAYAMNQVAALRNAYYFEKRYDFEGVACNALGANFALKFSVERGKQK